MEGKSIMTKTVMSIAVAGAALAFCGAARANNILAETWNATVTNSGGVADVNNVLGGGTIAQGTAAQLTISWDTTALDATDGNSSSPPCGSLPCQASSYGPPGYFAENGPVYVQGWTQDASAGAISFTLTINGHSLTVSDGTPNYHYGDASYSNNGAGSYFELNMYDLSSPYYNSRALVYSSTVPFAIGTIYSQSALSAFASQVNFAQVPISQAGGFENVFLGNFSSADAPEPASIALLSPALLGLGFLARRRRALERR